MNRELFVSLGLAKILRFRSDGCDNEDECGHVFVLVPVGHDDAEDTANLTQNTRTTASNPKEWRQRRWTATELVASRRARLAHR
jgi:hypothetical protein